MSALKTTLLRSAAALLSACFLIVPAWAQHGGGCACGHPQNAHPAWEIDLQKTGYFFHRLWKFVSEEPREANTEGGIFPAIFGTVLMVLLMSVNPGFGGQKFIQNTYRKIEETRNLISRTNARALIQIDKFDTIVTRLIL